MRTPFAWGPEIPPLPILSSKSVATDLVTVTLPPDPDGQVAKLFLRPWGVAQRLAAVRGYLQAMEASGSDAIADVAYVVDGVMAGMAGWEGFTAEGAPGQELVWSSEHRELLGLWLAENYQAYLAVKFQYVDPALAKDAEKNGSSLPRAGGSPAEATTPANLTATSNSSADGAGEITAPPVPSAAPSAPLA